MKMRLGRILSAFAFVLLLGFAAQPASAQHHAGSPPPPPPHYNGPRAYNHPRQQGAHPNRPAGNPAGRPNAFHPPSTYQPAPGANAQAGNSTHPANTFRSGDANSPQGDSRAGQTSNENTLHSSGTAGSNPQGGTNAGVNSSSEPKIPGQWTQKLGQMSPQQQNHFLQNNERFKNLPPEKQQQVRENLRKYNTLSPTERMAMKDRQATWERMSPEQRQYVQKTLLPKWQQMSSDRKQVVNDRLHTLQGMAPEDRQRSLNDPQFMRGLNPDEQSVLRGLDSVRNPSNP
jgi:Protein of unknown function (DUF3106)